MASEPATAVRVTPLFFCTPSRRQGWICIELRDRSATPRRKTISPMIWKQLLPLADREFDATCVLELGLALHTTP